MQITKKRFFVSENDNVEPNSMKDEDLFVGDSESEIDVPLNSHEIDGNDIANDDTSPITTNNLENTTLIENEDDLDIPSSSLPQMTPTQQKRTIEQTDFNPETELQVLKKKANLISEAFKKEEQENSWTRFVGSLNIQAWATRPTMRPLAYKSELTIKRLIPRNSSMTNSAIIRIAYQDREIGRLPEDITRIISPLIDLDICMFKGSVLEDTKIRLSTGDSFFIEIDIYLKNTAFIKNLGDVVEEENVKLNSKKKTKNNFNFSAESDGEAVLRLRQYAIQNLFEKLKIKPLKFNNDNEEEDEEAMIEMDKDDQTTPSEINLDQLRQFYQANNQSKLLESLPETTVPPDENLNLTLREYQKHGLSWMLAREKELEVLDMLAGESVTTQARANIEDSGSMNPLWRKYKWPTVDELDDKYFYANLYNGELSMEKPIIRSTLRGGILADEMGLGKTISALSLIASVPYDNEPPPKIKNQLPYAYKTTLIVVPMSLLSQWKDEFEKSNNNPSHYCRFYYGDEQENDLSPSLCSQGKKVPVIVLTTYGTILNEFTRISKNRRNGELPRIGLYSVKFFRIILDEGHNIRNRNTKTAKSIYELESSRKWILTGTPIVNRLDDLYSLTKFLKLDPWNNFSYWKTFITLPFENKKIAQTLDVIKSILEPIFLRRTKNQKMKNGKPLVELPAKEVVIEEIKFNEQELKLYQWFQKRAYDSFNENMKSGQVLKKYTQILTHILRLRQVCCHADLIGGSHEMDDDVIDHEDDEEMKKFLKSLKKEHTNESITNTNKFSNDTEVKTTMFRLYDKVAEENECSICTTTNIPFHELCLTSCGHTFCLTCILEHLDFQSELNKPKYCPNCREVISKYKLFKLRKQTVLSNEIKFHINEDPLKKEYNFQLYLYDPNKSSSKIQCLIKHLKTLQQQSPNSKCIIFSQFSSFLDLIQTELKLMSEFIIYKFDGSLNMNERSKLLTKFNLPNTNGKIVILLLSLKAGGVGLNLTTASRAFMMDPWWSPSIEDQAIDRLHRIGQNETVKVTRFIMENSIETKMLKIQERKKQIGEVVGVEEEERRKRRIEEIQILFEE